jgi:hypothetical protein
MPRRYEPICELGPGPVDGCPAGLAGPTSESSMDNSPLLYSLNKEEMRTG